ncbi:MAG TPA: histidine phosphatase family protein [Sulfuricurvum sp.]|nr:histidine phosphatase family protein [Sulfuricurvum sp.]
MKTLYLIRHAKSEWDNPLLKDFDRPLNKRGKKNAPFMGNVLAKAHIHPDLILSSPAVRAKMTAIEIAKKIGYDSDSIFYNKSLYAASCDEIQRVLKSIPSNHKTVFLIGHNPGLTEFAEYVSGHSIENIPTCGIVCVKLKEDDWSSIGEHSAQFVSFDYPKKHKEH